MASQLFLKGFLQPIIPTVMIVKVVVFCCFSLMIFAEFLWKTSYHNKQVTKSHGVGFHKLLFLVLLSVQRLHLCTISAQTCPCFQTTKAVQSLFLN